MTGKKATKTAAADLQQLKGVGKVLAQRLVDAGFGSFATIAAAGEERLKAIRGINPRALPALVEQARQLSETESGGAEERGESLKNRISDVREKVQMLAQSARERFQEQLTGKSGKKLSADLVRMEDALAGIGDGGIKRYKRAGKALRKAAKRVTGLEEASLKKIRKQLKRARKAVVKVI